METFIIILAIILGLLGIVGSIIPILPGPPLSWAGLLLVYLGTHGTDGSGTPMSLSFLLIWLAITIVVTVVDYIVPAWLVKKTGGSEYASRGAIAGLLVGILVPPVGIIIGMMAGAFLCEMIFAHKKLGSSLKSALGAFLGFLAGTGLKLICTGLLFYYIIVYIR